MAIQGLLLWDGWHVGIPLDMSCFVNNVTLFLSESSLGWWWWDRESIFFLGWNEFSWQKQHDKQVIHSFMEKPLYCIITNKESWIFQCFRLTSCWAEYILWTWCLLTRFWVSILVLIAFISFAVIEFTGQCGAIFPPFSHNLTSIEYLCDTANHETNITICLDYMFGLTDYSYFGSNTC